MPQKETVRYSIFQNVEIPEKTFIGHRFCQRVFSWVSHKEGFLGFPTKILLGFQQRGFPWVSDKD